MRIVGVVVVLGAAGCASARGSSASPEHLDGVSAENSIIVPSASEDVLTAQSDADAVISSLAGRESSAPIRASAAGADDDVIVNAPREGMYRDQRAFGPNNQPEWTTARPFATTRTYVLAPKQFEVEQWYVLRTPRHSSPDHSFETEFGFGLPGRLQLDFYEDYGIHGSDAPLKHDAVKVEGRWAFAEWNKIPLNPTLYLEVSEVHRAPDHIEGKLLLAHDFCDWRWAGNVSYDQEMGGVRATDIELTSGISRPIIDSKLNAGVEAKLSHVAGIGFRSHDDAINEFLVGPTLQWRPMSNLHIDLCPLFGLTHSDRRDPRMELFLVVGFDFGPKHDGNPAPVVSHRR